MTTQATAIALRTDIQGLQAEMQQAVGIVDRGMNSLTRSAGIARAAFAGLAGALSVGALAAGVKQVVDFGDELRDLSIATGASVEQLSFLDFASRQLGSSVETLTNGIGRLQRNLSEVIAGGGQQAARALDTLGLSAAELARVDVVTQLTTLGDALRAIENPAQRAAAAQQLFGTRLAKELLPVLLSGQRNLAELADRFVELNGVITTDQADSFDALNDSLGELRLSSQQLTRALATELAPTLTDLFRLMTDATNNVGPFFEFFTNRLRRGFLLLAQDAKALNLAIAEALQNTLGKLPGLDFSEQIQAARAGVREYELLLDDLDRDLEKKNQDRAQRRASLRAAVGGQGGIFSDFEGGGAGDDKATRAAERAAEARARREAEAIRQLELRLVAENDATQAARVRFEIEQGAYQEFSAAGRERLAQLAAEVDLQRESAEVHEYLLRIEEQRRAEAERARVALEQERQATIRALRTPQEVYADEVRRLLSLDLGDENLRRGIDAARQSLEGAQEKARQTNDAVRELGITFSSAFEQAVLGGQKLSEILQGLARDIAAIGLRKLVTEPFIRGLSSLFEGGEGGSSFFGGLFGNARGGLYRVAGAGGGERPIAFTARAGEFVAVGTRMEGGGGGGVKVEIVNTTGAPTRQENLGVIDGEQRIRVIIGDMIDERLSSSGGARNLQRTYGIMPRTVNR